MRDLDAWLKALVSTLDSADRPLADEIRAIRGSRSLTAPACRVRRTRASRSARRLSAVASQYRAARGPAGAGDCRRRARSSSSTTARARSGESRLQASSRSAAARRAGRRPHRGDRPAAASRTSARAGSWTKNTIVTNRHVAREFGRRTARRFTFKQGERRQADRGVHRLPRRSRPPRAARVSDRRDPPHRRRGRAGLRAAARREPVGRHDARAADPACRVARAARAAGRGDRISRPRQPGPGRRS